MKSDEVIVLEVRADGNDIEYRMSEGLADAITGFLYLSPHPRLSLWIGGFRRVGRSSRVADALKALSPHFSEAAQVKGKPRPRDTKNDLRGHKADLLYIDTTL